MSTSIEMIDKMKEAKEELISVGRKFDWLIEFFRGSKAEEEAEKPVSVEEPAVAETVDSNGQADHKAEKPSQSELVRRSLKEHGQARNKDIVEMIKSKHDIEVAASLVSYIRSKEGFKKPTEARVPRAKKAPAKASGATSGSSMIREYLERHPEASNEEVVNEVLKSRKVEVRPTLVSSVRAIMKKKVAKKSKASPKAEKKDKKKGRTGLPMPSLVVRVLEKSPREGLKWHETTDKVISAGYDYRGTKGYEGIAQNVYQALHALSKAVPHRGYNGKTAVVLHDEMSQRWKLNPKAVKKNVA